MGKTEAYIGLDVGTSGCKACVVDLQGRVRQIARRDYSLEYPSAEMVELNPVIVWKSVKETLKEIGAKTDCEIRMMAVSTIGEALVMLDKDERVLHNGITYLDGRGQETVGDVTQKIDPAYMQRLTGLPPRMFYTLNHLLWLQKHDPACIEQAEHIYMFDDYFTYMLTGERMIDPSLASKTWMLDTGRNTWSEKIGETFGIPLDRFSPVMPCGTFAGLIRPNLAEEFGLPKTMKVVLGCHDQCAATLGSGALHPGDIAAGEGSSESLNFIAKKEDLTDEFYSLNIGVEPYILPEYVIVPSAQHTHGTCIRWFVNEIWPDLAREVTDGKNIYDLANEKCPQEIEELYFLPYLTRSNLVDADNKSLGVFLGLQVETDRPQMYRAVLEGLCCETRHLFEVLQETGLPASSMVASGGCSKSPLFMQMKADMLGRPVSVLKNNDAGISGLAMICAVADGRCRDYEEAAEVFVETAGEYMPRRSYDDKYKRYDEIRRAIKQLYA